MPARPVSKWPLMRICLRASLTNKKPNAGGKRGRNQLLWIHGRWKFVRGDAIAGLIITFVNIVGGIGIGVTQAGLTFSEALHTYTIFTVGDGLVTQIPALIISTGRVCWSRKPGGVSAQIRPFSDCSGPIRPAALGLSSFLMTAFSFHHPIPMLPF